MASVDKQAVAAAFGRAAAHYHQHDELQRLSAAHLLAQLPSPSFARVLDAGCGPGSYSRYWRERGSYVTALDLSDDMLQQARHHQAADRYLQADIEDIPLPEVVNYGKSVIARLQKIPPCPSPLVSRPSQMTWPCSRYLIAMSMEWDWR